MPIRLFTVPFSEETQTFHDDVVQQFCVNKRIHKIETRFFVKHGQPYWTIAVLYGVILDDEKKGAGLQVRDSDYGLDEQQKALMLRLKEWRKQEAEVRGFPVYLIATNSQLAIMIKNKCMTLEALKLVKGFGKSRIEKYGKAATAIIQTFYQGS